MKHTATEKTAILAKQTLKIKDICVLMDCGYDRAKKLSLAYVPWFEKRHGYMPHDGQIATTEFLIFVNYDEDRTRRYAEMGL